MQSYKYLNSSPIHRILSLYLGPLGFFLVVILIIFYTNRKKGFLSSLLKFFGFLFGLVFLLFSLMGLDMWQARVRGEKFCSARIKGQKLSDVLATSESGGMFRIIVYDKHKEPVAVWRRNKWKGDPMSKEASEVSVMSHARGFSYYNCDVDIQDGVVVDAHGQAGD